MIADTAGMTLTNVNEQRTALMPGVIGFFFSFRLVIVLLSVHLFQADPQAGVMVSMGLNLLLFVAVAFHSFGPGLTTLRSTLRVPCFRWVLLFLAFSACSLFWTAAVSLSAAFVYWCAMAADVAMVVLLLRTGAESQVVSALMKGYVIGACLIAMIAWLMPSQSDLRLGDEELLGPNQIGYVCAFAVFFAQYLIREGASQWKIPSTLLAITLLRSLSKTTIAAFVLAQLFLLVRDTSIGRRNKILFAVATCLVIAIFWNLLGAYYEVYSNAGNQSVTLTGRLSIWAFILDKAVEQPWIGHGFHSVWKVIPPFDQGFEARHAHNELLQQFYAYGVAGVLMLVGLYGSFYRQIRRLPVGPLRTLLLGLLLFVLVRGLADTEAFDLSLPLWTISLIGLTIARASLPRDVGVSPLLSHGLPGLNNPDPPHKLENRAGALMSNDLSEATQR
jgi:exopolysaccharide production protein ExoQ